MRNRGKTLAVALALLTGASLFAPPASAQGFFESLFGGLRRAVRSAPSPTQIVSSFADSLGGTRDTPREAGSFASGYCVRSCDGHYFPVQTQGNVSAAELCSSFCPAAETKMYSGGDINYSVARDGSHYADTPTAFLYRQKMVEGCSCNGKTPYGLARVDVNTDPALRQGDIVATKAGFTAFTGFSNKTAQFTPMKDYRGLSQTTRDKLADTQINEQLPDRPAVALSAKPTKSDRNRAAELGRD
jgi:hypothetical protein